MRHFIVLTLLVLFCSCEKDELPKPITAGPSPNTMSVTMGSDYANQLFFELESASVTAQNLREDWDLGFECGDNGRRIVLNSSKLMAVSSTQSQDLAAVTSATPTAWVYDSPTGKADSSAFGNWELQRVYIVDRGTGTTGQQLGKIKMQVIAHSSTEYTIRWGSLAATSFNTTTISKSDDYNLRFLSFGNGGQFPSIEPEKSNWDLCFTSYTHLFHDGTPYLVTGVLSNRYATRVIESEFDFDLVDYTYASTADYSTDLDVIGYDWKTYNFSSSSYVTDFEKVYVIHSVKDRYYKLRFLDFYDGNGSKGTPVFELQELVP